MLPATIFGHTAHCASLADQRRTRQHSIRSTHLPLHDLFCGLLQSVPEILNTACRPSRASNFGLVESKHANSCNVNTASHFDLTIFCLFTRPDNLCSMMRQTLRPERRITTLPSIKISSKCEHEKKAIKGIYFYLFLTTETASTAVIC